MEKFGSVGNSTCHMRRAILKIRRIIQILNLYKCFQATNFRFFRSVIQHTRCNNKLKVNVLCDSDT